MAIAIKPARVRQLFLLLFLGFFSLQVSAQDDSLRFGDTNTTNTKPTYKTNKKSKRKRSIQWIKNDSEGLLLGNKCMEEVFDDMGFEYVIQLKGQPGYRNEFSRLAHNLGAKIGIMFRNGPFWKFRLKNEREKCREKTGDFVG
ncbi:MAG: hypothetical protein P8X57_06130 [Cyclobacteriaceae bacterium]